MMVLRRRYMGRRGPLPTGYRLGEYVENTANLCLFTGIYATSELEMRIDYEMTAVPQPMAYSSVTHVRNGYNTSVLTLGGEYGNKIPHLIRFGSKTYQLTLDRERHVVEWTGKMVYLDGARVIDGSSESFGASNYGIENRTIPLWGARSGNGNYIDRVQYSRARIYALTINGHEFLPCYGVKEQSWGLYDTTAKRFLFNKTALTGRLI